MKNLFIICMVIFVTFLNAQESKTYKNLSEALKNPDKVYHLNLNFAKLEVLPDSIGLLKNLTYLKISSNNLKTLPKSILNLKNLKELDISFNKIEKLPEDFGELKNLIKLKAGSNKITKLPESIGKLKNLTYLDISFNRLQTIPESIGNLKNLKILKINSNRLTSLPNSITKLKNLKRLDMNFNRYIALPKGIIEMTNLENIKDIRNIYNNVTAEEKQRKASQETEQQEDETSHFKYLLNFTTNDLINKNTKKFDEKKAYDALPWKIRDIYDYLNTKKEFIYNLQAYSFQDDKVTGSILVGYKIHKKNNEIESLLYNFTNKKFIQMRGMLAGLKLIIRKDSTSASMKFMPFLPLPIFRTLNKQETVTINNKTYNCSIVEGIFMSQKIRYWMVTDTPGLIVKMISESKYNRRTWTLKTVE